jgi:predicted DNA-binding transcriptional regulator YafY
MNRTDRLMAIVLLLRSRRKLTAQRLAEIFEVSTRTIYRDIDALCQAKVPVVAESGPDGGYSLLDTYSLPPIMFTLDEAVALFLGGSFVAHCQGTPFQEAIKTALIKIEDILPAALRGSVRLSAESILFDVVRGTDWAVAREAFATINEAIRERKCVRLLYHSLRRDALTERVVSPYGLIYDNQNGAWYLVGYCHLRDAQRMFHLSRIERVSRTDRRFEVPQEFELRRLAQRGWAKSLVESLAQDYPRIRIRVSKQVSERLRRDWLLRHAEREETPDGRVLLTYHDHLEPALYYPYRFGPDCEVLEPEELRVQVCEQVRQVLVTHGDVEGRKAQ